MVQPVDYSMVMELLERPWRSRQIQGDAAREAGLLLVVAATGEQQTHFARQVFTELVPLPPTSLLQLLRRLEPIRQNRWNDVELRSFTAELVDLVKPHQSQLKGQDRLVYDRAIADYLPIEQAVQRYAAFAEQHPNDIGIQRRYAQLLKEHNRRDTRQQALDQWRRVARLEEKQSVDWFAAKLEVANAHLNLGDRQEARDLVEYLTALYPDLGGAALRNQFEQLLERIPN